MSNDTTVKDIEDAVKAGNPKSVFADLIKEQSPSIIALLLAFWMLYDQVKDLQSKVDTLAIQVQVNQWTKDDQQQWVNATYAPAISKLESTMDKINDNLVEWKLQEKEQK